MINALLNYSANRKSIIQKALTLVCLFTIFIVLPSHSQVTMTTSGSYSQNFDGLPSTGSPVWTDNSTLANWYAQRSASTGTTIIASDGNTTSGGLYSFGTIASTERALGTIGSGTPKNFAYGIVFQNTSGITITDIKVSYKLEQWRVATTSTQTDSFFYKTSSSLITLLNPGLSLSNGWTNVASLNGISPTTSATAAPIDGNNALNQVSFTNVSIPALSLANNSYIFIKWDDIDHTGSDHGLSIDDVTITWTITPTSTATLANITQPSGSITQGATDAVLSGFTLSADVASDFTTVTVSTTGTATSTDISNVRVFRDNDGNGAINGSDAAVSASALAYAASMNFSITGETGITTGRNYLIVADIAQSGISTAGRTTTASVGSGAFVTTAAANLGSATGNSRTLIAPNPTQLAITNINPASPFTNTAFSVTVQSQDANGIVSAVTSNTSVSITLASGTGNLTGTLTGVIGIGTSQVIITGVLYDVAETGVSLTATRTTGDILTAGTSGTFAVTVNVTSMIFVSASITPFSTAVGTPSGTQSYSVSGSNLNIGAGISIAPPAAFEISGNGGTSWTVFPNSLTIADIAGVVSPTSILIRYNPAASGSNSGNIQHTSTGATQVDLAVSGSAIEAEPNTQSVITFGVVSGSSIEVNFGGGNGTSRVVVASLSPITFLPGDGAGIAGTVSANFTLATDQGAGNKVVYDGSLNTVTVTNLSGSTLYYFAVYEFNGSGVTANYFTSSPGLGNKSTIASEPASSATTSFTRIKETELYISFTGGSGPNRMVVVNSAAVTFTPIDGSTYTGANTVFTSATDQGGGNKIVYDGTATSVIVTGLTRGTTYNVHVYEYNGTSLATNYLTSTFGNATGTTPDYISYSTGTYTQDFNGLNVSGSFGTTGFGQGPYYVSTPPMNATSATGWQILNQLSGDIKWTVDAGSGTGGSAYSYGSAASTDRALGALSSGTVIPALGAVLVNNSGGPLSDVTITFVGEQWKYAASVAGTLTFEYQIGGSDILTGTFTTVNGLNFTSPVTAGIAGPLDGNAAANRTAVNYSFTLSGNWLQGQTLAIRWKDFNDSGSDDALAIDDFTFSATGPQTPLTQDNNISFFTTLTNATGVSWTNGDGVSRIVKMNTVNSFTDPTDGNTYTGNTVYGGGEQVVFDGPGSTVNITNLTPATQYFFRVYGYNGTGVATKYNVTTAALNPNNIITAAPSFPTQLVVLDVNGGLDVVVNQPFTVTIQSQDGAGSPQNVTQNTTVDLTVFAGFGTLASGNTTGVITSGTNTITISGIIYDYAEPGVTLNAAATAGDVLTDGQTTIFTVYDIASDLQFANTPANGVVGLPVNPFYVYAVRPDATTDPYYVGSATITVFVGPGIISGTLTEPFVNGIATFSNVAFSSVGTYVLEATSGTLNSTLSSNILINPPIAFTELVVPQYIGSKTTGGASGTNTDRTPIAACFQIDNLTPNTTYNVAAGIGLVSEVNTTLGAGSLWNGTAYSGQIRSAAFTTDANGASGPVWIYIQPSANQTRFGGGEIHNIRIAYSTGSFGSNIVPNFITTKTITALDIANGTPITAATTDDGAFLTGALSACIGGKYILIYDNTSGTGDPMFVYQANPSTPNQPTQVTLPVSVDQIFMGTAAAGTFAAVYPIGANNANGVRRVEARNADNTIAAFATSATGIWPGGTNTTTATRRAVVALSATDVNLSSVTVSASATDVLCFGMATGTAAATASSANSPITYSWSPGLETTTSISGLVAGTYVVTATDAIGCTASASATVNQPTDLVIVGQVTNTGCAGGNTGAVDITVAGGVPSYTFLWSGSETTEDLTGLAAGTYSVLVTDANGCTKSATFTVITQNSNPTINATATPATICAGESSTLEATGALTYAWSPTGDIVPTTGAIVIATPTATTTYSVVAVDNNGCQSIGTVTLTVNPLPVVLVSPTTSSICDGSTVTLTASGASTYAWSPTSGLTPTTGAVVAATPSATTIYTVTGTSVDGCVASASTTINVTSVSAPTATTPVVYCQNAVASPLSATPIGGNELWWYTAPTGGSGSLIAPTPSTAAAGSTTYYVSQQAAAPLSIAINGYMDNTVPDEFAFVALSKIPAGTVIYFTDNGYITTPVLPATIGFRGATALNAKGNEDMTKITAINTIAAGTVIRSYVSTADYSWTFTGPITCSTCTTVSNYSALAFAAANDQIYAFTSTTTDNPLFNIAQQVHLYVFDDSNAFESATSTATGAIPPGLTAGVTANTFPFASSNYVNLNNDGLTRTIAAWRTYMSLSSNYTIGTGVGPGVPSASLNVDLGCESARTPIVVTVNEAPVVTATPTAILCNGGTSVVTVTATAGLAPYTGEGTFTVTAGSHTYSVSDANSCSGSTTISITEPTAVSASAVLTTPILCNGGTATVTVSATGGTSPYTGEGVFTVSAGTHSYTITDANLCTGTTSITVAEPDAIIVTATETTSIVCPGGTATVTVSATGGTSPYTGEGVFTVSAGTYTYTITDANLCTGSTSIVISDPASVSATSFAPTSGCEGSIVSIFGTNLNLVTSVDLNGISAIFGYINPGEIQVTIPPSATSGLFNLYTAANCTSSTAASFTVTTCSTGMVLNLKAFLQGFYIGGSQMNPALAYEGVPGATGLEADTIQVDIYDEFTFAPAGSAKAVLMTDGTATVTINGADANYFISVRHRNSVITWSSVAIPFASATPVSYDFTTSQTQAMSGWMADDYSEGIYSIFSGDINQDEWVDANDYPFFDIDNSLGLCCDYYATDLNGDGFVDANDYPFFSINNDNGVFSIHP